MTYLSTVIHPTLVAKDIYQVIKQLKTGKSAGPDSIPGEALETNIETSVELLYTLFQKIWEEEQVSLEWKKGYVLKLPKKGDLNSCSSCRRIVPPSIPGKVFNRVLMNMMKDGVNPQPQDQQAGFRGGRPCT